MTNALRLLSFTLAFATLLATAYADSLVINNLYDCQRATNGRAYCKRVGASASAPYVPVSESFFDTYETARTGKAPVVIEQPKTVVNTTQVNNITITLKDQATNIAGQILALEAVLREQEQLAKSDEADRTLANDAIAAINDRLTDLKAALATKNEALSKYSTPIRPDDMNLGVTARKASEFYPKIPYYIPGTRETGEFWVEPVVTDTGTLEFNFKFVDVDSAIAEKVRGSIEMSISQLESTRLALAKAAKNSRIAHEKGIRRKFDQRLVCFPEADCPPEGKKMDAKASTEILFSINDDGSTNARIQRNKGRFEEGYNVSIKSALLLQAYLSFVLKHAQKEFNAGSASEDDIRQLFK